MNLFEEFVMELVDIGHSLIEDLYLRKNKNHF